MMVRSRFAIIFLGFALEREALAGASLVNGGDLGVGIVGLMVA